MSETMTKEELERKLKIDEDLKTMQTWSETPGYATAMTREEALRQDEARRTRLREAYRGYEELSGKQLSNRISGEPLPMIRQNIESLPSLEVAPADESYKQKKKRLNEIKEAQKHCEGATHTTYEMHQALSNLNPAAVEMEQNREEISRFEEETGMSISSASIFMEPVHRNKKGKPLTPEDERADELNRLIQMLLLKREETDEGVFPIDVHKQFYFDLFVTEAQKFKVTGEMLNAQYIKAHISEIVTGIKKWEAVNDVCLSNKAYLKTLSMNERVALNLQVELMQKMKDMVEGFLNDSGVTINGEYMDRAEKNDTRRDDPYTKFKEFYEAFNDKYVDNIVERYSFRITNFRDEVEADYDNSSVESELEPLRDMLTTNPEVYEQNKEAINKSYQITYQTAQLVEELKKDEEVYTRLLAYIQTTENISSRESQMGLSPVDAIAQKIEETKSKREAVEESLRAYKETVLYMAGISEYSSGVMVGIGRMGLEKEFFEKKLDALKLEKRRTGGRFNPNPEGVDLEKFRTTVAGWVESSDSLAPKLIPYKEKITRATEALERARQENKSKEEIEALERELKNSQIEYSKFCPNVYGKIDFRGDNTMGRMENAMDGVSLDLRRDLVEYSLLLGENLPLEDIVAQSRRCKLTDTSALTFYDGPGMDLIVDRMFDMITEALASEEFLKFMKMEYDLIKDAKVFQDDKMLAVKLIMKNEVNRRVTSFSSDLLPVLREKNLKLEPEKMKTINKFIGMACKCIATVYGAVEVEDYGEEMPEQYKGMVAKYNAMCKRVLDYATTGDSTGNAAAPAGN